MRIVTKKMKLLSKWNVNLIKMKSNKRNYKLSKMDLYHKRLCHEGCKHRIHDFIYS